MNKQQIKLITAREAAEILRLSNKTLYNNGAGTHVLQRKRLGRRVFFIESEVISLLNQGLKG